MKKLFATLFLIALCLCCLVSCNGYEEKLWFSDETLEGCLVPGLPTVEKSFVGDGDDVRVSFSATEFKNYAQSVYEYLKSQNFEYLGTRGDIKSSLAGLFATYYFKPAEELDEFIVNGNYIFVYSDGTLDEYGEPTFCIVGIYDYGKSRMDIDRKENFAFNRKKTFTYTTEISVRKDMEFALGGQYELPEEDEDASALLCDYEGWLNELDADKVAQIKTTREGVGVPPGSLKKINRTEDTEIIQGLINAYKSATMTPITREEAEIDGGSAFTVEFILTDGGIKKLSFNNGNYFYYGVSQHTSPLYCFALDAIPNIEGGESTGECYSFVTYLDTGTVYSGGKELCEISVGELEFVELKEKIGLPEWVMYEVETEFGKLIFKTEDIFHVEGADIYYRLTEDNKWADGKQTVSPQYLRCSRQRKKALKIAFQSQNGRSDRT